MSKTLNKSITAQFFATEGGYDEMRCRWAEMVSLGTILTASHHAFYLALSGKNLAKAFAPTTNEVALANGQGAYDGANRAIGGIWQWDFVARTYVINPELNQLFVDLLSPAVATLLRSVLPTKIRSNADLAYNLPVVEEAAKVS